MDNLLVEFGKTEIRDFHASVADEDVGGFQVPVGHSFFSHVLQTLPEVDDDCWEFLIWKWLAGLDAVVKVPLSTKFGDYVAVPFREHRFDKT